MSSGNGYIGSLGKWEKSCQLKDEHTAKAEGASPYVAGSSMDRLACSWSDWRAGVPAPHRHTLPRFFYSDSAIQVPLVRFRALDFFYVDGFGFCIQGADNLGFLAHEFAHGILVVEAVNVLARSKHEFSS